MCVSACARARQPPAYVHKRRRLLTTGYFVRVPPPRPNQRSRQAARPNVVHVTVCQSAACESARARARELVQCARNGSGEIRLRHTEQPLPQQSHVHEPANSVYLYLFVLLCCRFFSLPSRRCVRMLCWWPLFLRMRFGHGFVRFRLGNAKKSTHTRRFSPNCQTAPATEE